MDDPQPARIIRVFISSTFRDMQAEREELVKFIFPQLRKLCEQRGVTWAEVDLRWGITDEQKAEGKVLPICMDEIQRCRPYFLGLLGERYGWIPEEIPQELIEREPWLTEHYDQSVTELEILHGVLNNPDMAKHAFFYFRDPAYLDSLPPEQRSTFREEPTENEIKKLGLTEAQHRVEVRQEKLAALKKRIRNSAFPVKENYLDSKQLGEWVLHDLTQVIDRLFPEGSQPDPLAREAADHEAFASSRARVYIGRQVYFDHLNTHAQGDGPPLVILGESGSGKSALLANWVLHYREENPKELVLVHFIGATPASTDWAAMLRRIMGELKRLFDIREEIPDQIEALRSTFANWLHRVAAKGKVVIILDALNQLEDRDGAPDLVWLPPEIPGNVRLVLSTLPGRSLDELEKRGWPTRLVEPINLVEREQLIKQYLASFTKSLSPARAQRIANAPQCQNPLFLRALLDELRLFGIYEQLDQRIDACLKATTIPALYEIILGRCEQDYERDRPGLIGDSMSLLWVARRGLSEAELMELLGSHGQPLPRAYWSPFYLAMEQSFTNRGGLVGFFHDYLRQAIQNRYLPTQANQQKKHLFLADYFESQPPQTNRRIDELPWQLAQAGEWQRLYSLLANLDFISTAWKNNQFEVKSYWTQVESNSPYRMLKAYESVIKSPDPSRDIETWILGILLADSGYASEALSLRSYLVEHFRKIGDLDGLQSSLNNQALILKTRGDLDGAMALHKEQERICRQTGNLYGLQLSLGNQANILYAQGDLDGAMALHKEEERICRQFGDLDDLQGSLNNQALILRDRGDLQGAMGLHKEQERICRQLGNLDGLQRSLGNRAHILYDRGDLDGTMALLKEKEHICRQLGDLNDLQSSLGAQALVLKHRGDLDGAMALHKEQERICRQLGNLDDLSVSLGNQALILKHRGDLNGAMGLHKEQERICRQLGDLNGLQSSLNNQSNILYEHGDLDKAMLLHEEVKSLCRQLGNQQGLAISFTNQAIIHYQRGERKEAYNLFQEALIIAKKYGYRSLVSQIENNLKYF